MLKQCGPPTRKHINKLERIQRMATKLVPELEGLQYQDRRGATRLTSRIAHLPRHQLKGRRRNQRIKREAVMGKLEKVSCEEE